MPDLNYSIDLHDAIMHGWWRDPEYIRERKAFVARHPVCIRCGKPCTTPGHSHGDYRDFRTYLDAVKTDKCDPLCNLCTKKERAGLRPCPVCIAKHKEDPTVKIHYIPADSAEGHCRYCDPQYNPERIRYKRELKNRIKRAISRENYNRTHPHIKIVNIKTGQGETRARV